MPFGERPCPLPLLAAQYLGHGCIFELSYKIRVGTAPKYANARTCPFRKASVVSAGNAATERVPLE